MRRAVMRTVALTSLGFATNIPAVGFFSRMFVPRGVRRAMHPGRAAKRAVTPKSVKRARRAMHPISNAAYSLERSLNTKPRRRASKAPPTHTDPAPCSTEPGCGYALPQ